MKHLTLSSLGQIREADIVFGDLTVFVGEQASGKSVLLQMIKLILDADNITQTLKKHGYDWQKKTDDFLSLYFGEGMAGIWDNAATSISIDSKDCDLKKILSKRISQKGENLFLIPAHRVVSLKDGWPRAFTDYTISDPYVLREFSEKLRQQMEAGLGSGESAIFPQKGRMNKTIRDAIGQSIFGEGEIKLDRSGFRKRIILDIAGSKLPFMTWSTGQREFAPLLLGLYILMPLHKVKKRDNINFVVIEEPEMGLHPKAISASLTVILELIRRGYKVIISTHSSQVLELVWSIQYLVKAGAEPKHLLKVLDLKSNSFSKSLSETVFERTFKTYYFSRQENVVSVKDISSLDAEDPDEAVSDFGGLTTFSTKVSEVVSKAMWKKDL